MLFRSTPDMSVAEYAADRCAGTIRTGPFTPTDADVDDIVRGYLVVVLRIETNGTVGLTTTCVYVAHPPLNQAEEDEMGQVTASVHLGPDWQDAVLAVTGYRRSELVPRVERAAAEVADRMTAGVSLLEALPPIPVESVQRYRPEPPPSDEDVAIRKAALIGLFLRDMETAAARPNRSAEFGTDDVR